MRNRRERLAAVLASVEGLGDREARWLMGDGGRVAVERVWVDSWRNVGDAYEEQTEDGPRTRLPADEPVVMALTYAGRLCCLRTKYGNTPMEWARADSAAWTVEAAGTIRPERWHYIRGVYGSDAYEADGWLAYDKQLD